MKNPNDVLFEGFQPYQRACNLAEKLDLVPVRDPSQGDFERLAEIVNRVLPKVQNRDENELPLLGIVLYAAEDQHVESDRQSLALTVWDEVGAVIGLSVELLRLMLGIFADVVMLHELAHLSIHDHGDRFQVYSNWLFLQYFSGLCDKNGKPRFDAADKIIRHYRNWRI